MRPSLTLSRRSFNVATAELLEPLCGEDRPKVLPFATPVVYI